MKTNRIVQVEIPTDLYLASQAALERAMAEPDRLAAQVAAVNTPENLTALQGRLAAYRAHRVVAEAEFFAFSEGAR